MDVIHVAVAVADLDGMCAFYRDVIGLEETNRFSHGGIDNVYFGGEHGEIQLRSVPEYPVETEGDGSIVEHIALGVDDVEAEIDRLRAAGVPVLKDPTVVEVAGAKIAFVEDPEGNVLELVESIS